MLQKVQGLKWTHSVVELGFVSAARFSAFISDGFVLSLIAWQYLFQ